MVTEAEVRQWAMLRAIEWSSWPLFVSQPLVPLLFIVLKWWLVIVGVVVANLLWSMLRQRFVSARIADFGCLFAKLKWISSPGVAIYFYMHDNIPLALLALFWPLVTSLLTITNLIPTRLNLIERKLLIEVGALPAIFEDE